MNSFTKILKLLKGKKTLIIVALVFAFISVILSLYINVVIGYAVDCLDLTKLENVDVDGIKKNVLIIAGCTVFSCIFNYFMNLLLNKAAFSAVKLLRTKLFDKLQKIHIKHIDTRSPGDMISRLINDIEQVSDGLILSFG